MNALHTRICDLFGIQFPIIQTGMGWVAGPRLVAATSSAGGLGLLASATMNFEQLKAAIADVKSRTDKPFGVNLLSNPPDINQRIELLIKERIKVASFAQAPGKELVKRLKGEGVLTMPTIGARRHAEKVAEWGVDAVIAQGHEGGGHTGAVPTTLLLPQVTSAVDIPVLGAGGFFDGRGLVAALAYGASGIAMGTRFLMAKESTVPEHIKQLYVAAQVTDTVVTKSIDGVAQRVIRTKLVDSLDGAGPIVTLFRAVRYALAFRGLTGRSFMDLLTEGLAMKKSQSLTYGQLLMAANAPMLTKAALVDGKAEAGVLPTGQVAGVITELSSVADIIARIMGEAEETLARLSGTAASQNQAPSVAKVEGAV